MSPAEWRYRDELARIDREWEVEREKYKVTLRGGRREVPAVRAGVLTAAGGGASA